MKMHIVTIGEPKLAYARLGWQEYLGRLRHFHDLRVTHVPDKYAYDSAHIRQAAGNAYRIALVIGGKQFTSPQLAQLLEKRSLEAREICFIIGGPEGLPEELRTTADLRLGLSELTFPHDLAMVVLVEALYRASSINAGLPYHK